MAENLRMVFLRAKLAVLWLLELLCNDQASTRS